MASTILDLIEKANASLGRNAQEAKKRRGQQAPAKIPTVKPAPRSNAVKDSAAQLLSSHDLTELSMGSQNIVREAKADYDRAKAAGDRAGMAAAHEKAEAARRQHGYSGGITGSEYIAPELSAREKIMLTEEGEQQLRRARMENDSKREEEVLNAQGYREYTNYTKNKKKREQAEAALKAAGTGVAGSLLSLSETARQAMRNYQQDRWGMQPEGTRRTVDPNLLGQRLLQASGKYAQEATAGKNDLSRFLTETAISGTQMLPSIAASFIPGIGPAVGAGIMGAQAAGSKAYEVNASGAEAGEAMTRGLLSGGIEGLTERMGLSNLVKIVNRAGGASFLKNVAQQAGIEATEESASYVLNLAADVAAENPNAQVSLSDFINGMADQFSFSELAQNAAAGALLGGAFAGGGTAINRAITGPVQTQQEAPDNPLLRASGFYDRQAEKTPEEAQEAEDGALDLQETAAGIMQEERREEGQVSTAEPKPVNTNEDGEIVPIKTGTLSGYPGDTTSPSAEPAEQPSVRLTGIPQDTVAAPGIFNDTLTQAETEVNGQNLPEGTGAASAGFDPYTQALNEYGAIDPGENPARMVDVPLSTDGENRVRRWARTAMEAEVTTEETIKNLERDIVNNGFSYRPRKDKQSLENAIGVIESYGIDPALAQWQEVVDGRRSAEKDDIVLAETLYISAERTGDTELASRLAAEIAAEGTRMGQGVQALRLLKKATKEGRVYYIRKSVEYVKQELQGRMGDRAKDISISDELIQNYMDAQGKAAEDDALDAIYTHVAEQIPPTLNDRMTAWRYFAMLGNPKTHIKNFIGNVMFGGVYRGSNQVSALLQRAFLAEENRTRSFIADAKAKEFATADWEEAKGILSGDKYSMGYSAIQRKVQERSLGVFNRPAKFSSDKMEQADTWAKKGQYIQSMAKFITARGWDPANLTKQQLETARSHALLDAQRATFTEASDLAKTLTQLEQKNKAWNVAIGGVVPFKGVPINIAKQGFNLSPAGLMKSLTYGLYKVKTGERTAAEAIDHISQGLTGTSVAAIGAFLASQGILRGMDSDDEKERLLDEASGEQEYSIDLEALSGLFGMEGPEYTYTIDWAAPAVIPLFFGAEVYQGVLDVAKELGEEDFPLSKALEIATNALVNTFEPMMNMTMLSGLSDTLRAAAYGDTNAFVKTALESAEGFAGQFVPTLLGQIARTIDDTRRTTFGDKNEGFPGLQKFLQQQENKIPGMSQGNLPYLNVWGEEDKTENPLLRAFENFVSPGYVAKKSGGSTEEELKRLHELGYEDVLPGMVDKSAKVNDKYVTGDQWVNMQTTRGKTAKSVLDSFIGTEQYNAMTDDERAKFVKKVLEYGSDTGKVTGGADADETFARWQEAAQNAKEEVGLSEAEIIAASAYQSVLGENLDDETKASFKQGQFEQWVNSRTDWTEEQQNYVKENIKFYSMIPADAGKYNRVVDAGYSIERTEELLTARSEYDDSNNGLYEFVISQESDYAAQEKLYNAFKDKGAAKTWAELSKEQAPVSSRIKAAKANVDSVMDADRQTAFEEAVGEFGKGSRYAVYQGLMSIEATDEERRVYYEYIRSQRSNPWKASWAQMKANGGYP